jgi:hypothetical protein
MSDEVKGYEFQVPQVTASIFMQLTFPLRTTSMCW